MSTNILGVLFVVVIITGILELIARLTWQSFYFRFGIPLYKKSIRLSTSPDLSVDYLNGQFEKGRYVALRFKQISLHEVAFREALSVSSDFLKFFIGLFKRIDINIKGWPKKTNIHGLILYDETTRQLHVIGFANLSTPLFIILFIGVSSSGIFSSFSLASDDLISTVLISFIPLVILIVIITSMYLVKTKRYAAVLKNFSSE